MNKRKKIILWSVVGAAILAFCLWHPILRQVILFILPLGSGIDDLVMFAAIGFAVIGLIWHSASRNNKKRKIRRMEDGLEPFRNGVDPQSDRTQKMYRKEK